MMSLEYDREADAASVLVRGPVRPGARVALDRLDADRLVHFGSDDEILEYEFLNARRYGVRLDDLEHRDELARLFAEAGFQERHWGHPIPTRVRRGRERSAG
ncbi:MAG: hypothetical protein IT305_19565 [Chloroflexi bacterium]|nr:hypothetical protein [Chloroflexota bacterium]